MDKVINVEMRDELTDKMVSRQIDGSNFLVHDGETSYFTDCPERQRSMLLEWIRDRAEAQHETILNLVSWNVQKVA